MTTTTSYGTWNNRADSASLTVESTVAAALGDYAGDHDVDAIATEYRRAINEALPGSVNLCGNEFIGPYHAEDCEFDDYPADEFYSLDIQEIVNGVDFWDIAAKYDKR